MNLKGLSDEKVVLYIQQKGEAGIEELIDRYQSKLTRYVIGLTKDENQTDDVVQETFISVYRNINSFDSGRKFSSWIYRIAHNKAINEMRKHNILIGLDRIKEIPDEKIDGKNIEKTVDSENTKKIVLESIGKLSIKYREIMILRYFEDKSYEEISDIIHIPKNTVGVRISRGLEILKKNLNINVEDYL